MNFLELEKSIVRPSEIASFYTADCWVVNLKSFSRKALCLLKMVGCDENARSTRQLSSMDERIARRAQNRLSQSDRNERASQSRLLARSAKCDRSPFSSEIWA